MSEPYAAVATNVRSLHWFSRHAMACDWGIAIGSADDTSARHAARAAFDEVDRLESELSRFIPSSDVARINAAPADQWAPVGIDCLECLRLAARVHAATGGAFDVTAAQSAAAAGVPGANRQWGMTDLEVDRENRRVRKGVAGLAVDLGAIGKGYAVDRAVEVLREWGVESGLVHSGQSSLFAIGAPVDGSHWNVPLRDPRDQVGRMGAVELRDESLSGSGVSIHGRHIIDGRTGLPADERIAAWAVAPLAALSDALSTAFMILPQRDIAAICRQDRSLRGYWAAGTRAGDLVLRSAADVPDQSDSGH